jgi:hypothetical protein
MEIRTEAARLRAEGRPEVTAEILEEDIRAADILAEGTPAVEAIRAVAVAAVVEVPVEDIPVVEVEVLAEGAPAAVADIRVVAEEEDRLAEVVVHPEEAADAATSYGLM